MILEVNNTFDERRLYFLKDSKMDAVQDETKGKEPASTNFATTWPKDFHVSPFNSRKGSYSLAALDPFASHPHGKGPVDNTITLSSSKQHGKLVARVSSTAKPLDPTKFGTLDVWKFIASWWWVGLVTFPRIVREAAKLFFRRKLHVWYRPEVLKDSMGRTETNDERYLNPSKSSSVRLDKLIAQQSHRAGLQRLSETNSRKVRPPNTSQIHFSASNRSRRGGLRFRQAAYHPQSFTGGHDLQTYVAALLR